MPRSVLVTGASSGIGRATALELVTTGFHVWAAVLDEDYDEVSKDLAGDDITVIRLDLTSAESIAAAGEEVRAAGPLYGLVNNAGMAISGPLEYLPIDAFRRQLEVNLIGHLAVTQAMLPALRASAAGAGDGARIVLTGSILGRIGAPMLGPYCASKFGLRGMADSLRAELAPAGIRVVLIEPGSIATPIWTRGQETADEIAEQLPPEAEQHYAGQRERSRRAAEQFAARGIPPERVARVIVQAMTQRSPRPRRLVGPDALVIAAALRLLPDRLINRVISPS
jgi:NAD(P)-dependent dehydrogenase (short-subunit alcohol dehydrogenase family)